MVIAEAGWLIARQLGALAEAEFYRSVLAGELEVEPLGREHWERIAELTEKYADNDLGGVDSSLIAVAEHLRLDTIATLDHRHFRAVRPKHLKAFKIVP
jgi:predicted nucleic acid-binding protein